MKAQVFNYNGTNITFQLGNGDVMVNATEMSKKFNKSPNHFLRTQSTNNFINELSALRKCNPTDLVQVINGGNSFGTWMHEDVALEFARWLNPSFAIWCNDRIKELLKHGMTATPQKLEEMLTNPDLLINLATTLKKERAEKERLEQQNNKHIQIIKEQAPKVLFANAVEGSKSSCLVGELAKILRQNGISIGEHRLFKWLRENKYLGNKGERYNIPMQRYIEQGLFTLKKGVRSGNGGVLKTTITTKVTGKGQFYFISKFLETV